MKKLIILALAAISFAACGNATVVNNEPDEPVKDLLALYADSTDAQHVFIMGASMGGAGTWRLLGEMPNTFAAALIASGSYRRAKGNTAWMAEDRGVSV